MTGKGKQIWIDKGYQMISNDGFNSVNIESIARSVNKNKSSFYYYFGDWENFEIALLSHHEHIAKEFSTKLIACKSIIPDMVDIFIEHQTDIFFHKQLRINRHKINYTRCFESVYELFERGILEKWGAFLQMENYSFLASKILRLLSDNFLLQITHDSYNPEWIKAYLLEIASLLGEIYLRAKGDS